MPRTLEVIHAERDEITHADAIAAGNERAIEGVLYRLKSQRERNRIKLARLAAEANALMAEEACDPNAVTVIVQQPG